MAKPPTRLLLRPPLLQVRFRQLAPSGLVKAMEGVNMVVPLPPDCPDADPIAHLEGATEHFLRSLGLSKAAGAGPSESPAAPVPSGGGSIAGLEAPLQAQEQGQGQEQEGQQQPLPQRSIVIMHHKVKLKLPRGVGKLLTGAGGRASAVGTLPAAIGWWYSKS